MNDKKLPYLLIGVPIIFALLIIFSPVIYAIYLSLFKLMYFGSGPFIGLGNYDRMIHDRIFVRSLLTSIKFGFSSLGITFTLAMFFALALNKLGSKGTSLLTLLLIPWAMSRIVGSMLWKWIFTDFEGGILFYFMSVIGISYQSILGNPTSAFWALVFNAVWRTVGFATILILAGMKSIPDNLYRSASVDGSSKIHQFFRITVPLLKIPILIVIAQLTMSYFNEITLPLILTGGGPAYATNTLSLFAYTKGFTNFEFGYSNALVITQFLINLILLLIYIRALKMREIYN